MRFTQPLQAAGLLLSLTTLNAEATLISYTSVGEDLVYSSVSDITWTADANLLGSLISNQGFNNVVNAIIAVSPLIYDTPNYYDGSFNNHGSYSGQYSLSANDFNSNGRATWFGAQAFTAYLNSINYAGTNQWSLPAAGANPQEGNNQTSGQFGQLYYNELSAMAYPGTNGRNYGILGDGRYGTSGTAGPFSNAQTFGYWFGTESSTPGYPWSFYASNGNQTGNVNYNQFYAWVVSPGQVASVPVSGTVWLFGTGLLGWLGLIRRRHDGYFG